MMTLKDEKRSPWREPVVWLVVALPAAAVVATVAMLVAASRSSGTSDPVAGDVRRTAQVQVADLDPDARAQRLGLSAVVRTGKGTVEVLPVAGEFDRQAPLALTLRHPSRAEQDVPLELQPSATGWQAGADLDLSHDWNVQLGPADGSWRLQGRWTARQQATYLRPALDRD